MRGSRAAGRSPVIFPVKRYISDAKGGFGEVARRDEVLCERLDLFREAPFLERFGRAREAGFSAVEFWWPAGEDLGEVERTVKDADLTVALFNFDAGDMPNGDRGLPGDPARVEQFRENVPVVLNLAKRLDCGRPNALVGHEVPGMSREEQLELARKNVAWAAGRAEEQGVRVMVEAVNTFENSPYLLSTTAQAAEFVRSVGRANVMLQYDVYHMQRMEGNLVANMREHVGEIGHVQIAGSPGRGSRGPVISTPPTSSPPSKTSATMVTSAWSTTRRRRRPKRASRGCRKSCAVARQAPET